MINQIVISLTDMETRLAKVIQHDYLSQSSFAESSKYKNAKLHDQPLYTRPVDHTDTELAAKRYRDLCFLLFSVLYV